MSKQNQPEKKRADYMRKFTASERYMAFLVTEIPRLQAVCPPSKISCAFSQQTLMSIAMDLLPQTNGLALEFGVFKGKSISYFCNRHPKRIFHGFDSFEGFPADGRPDWKRDFSLDQLPDVPKNCRLIKGYFSNTLPNFLVKYPKPIDFLHIDCDIYSSTVDVFTALESKERMQPGIICLFDELINYSTWLWNEMLALFEMLERTGLGIEWIAINRYARTVEETLEWCLKDKEARPFSWQEERKKGFDYQVLSRFSDAGIVNLIKNKDRGEIYFPKDYYRIGLAFFKLNQYTDAYFFLQKACKYLTNFESASKYYEKCIQLQQKI